MNAMIATVKARTVRKAAAGLALAALGLGTVPALAEDPVATVSYTCKEGKTIKAVFYSDKVDLTLAGKQISLPQAPSADGGRYATADESLVFWAVGDKAYVTEGDPDVQTYADCVGKPE